MIAVQYCPMQPVELGWIKRLLTDGYSNLRIAAVIDRSEKIVVATRKRARIAAPKKYRSGNKGRPIPVDLAERVARECEAARAEWHAAKAAQKLAAKARSEPAAAAASSHPRESDTIPKVVWRYQTSGGWNHSMTPITLARVGGIISPAETGARPYTISGRQRQIGA